ncbi:MAG: inositol monophosphatase family protein, partial [Ginsengibacter sp.]
MFKSTLIKATEAGARELQRFFNGTFKISNKEGVNNLVTEADHAAEKAIIDIITENFPEHNILSEEAGEVLITGRPKDVGSEFKWIIDPIDGTVNFANGIPICCVSVALEHNGSIILGA